MNLKFALIGGKEGLINEQMLIGLINGTSIIKSITSTFSKEVDQYDYPVKIYVEMVIESLHKRQEEVNEITNISNQTIEEMKKPII